MKTSEIREALRTEFGGRKYRITKTGEIHVYGKIPNTNHKGWWFYGYLGDCETEARIANL